MYCRNIYEIKCRYLFMLSSSGPGPGQVPGQVQGLRTKDLDLDYTLNLVCHHPPLNFYWGDNASKPFCMPSNHVPLKSAFRMTFRMTFRLTLRMTFKTWDFRGVFKEVFEVDFEEYFKGSSRWCLRGSCRGT